MRYMEIRRHDGGSNPIRNAGFFPKPKMWWRELMSRRTPSTFLAMLAVFVLSVAAIPQAEAEETEAVRAPIERLSEVLLEVMQEARELGYEGRYDRLEPVLAETFNFPFMTRVAVGRDWANLSRDEQAHLVELFSDMSVANFAARFDGYSGETFELLGERPGPREAILVETRLVRPRGTPVGLDYLLREFPDGWQIIDVFLDSRFSELARQRAEFAAVLRDRGYAGLVATIESKIEQLASGTG